MAINLTNNLKLKFAFSGCSFTEQPIGYAYHLENFYKANIKNLSVQGNSNHNIFMTSLNEILFNTPDIMFVQWSALNRLWIYPSPNSSSCIATNGVTDDIRTGTFESSKGLVLSKKDLTNFGKMYNLLNHDYNLILQLVNYCKILESVANNACHLVFINGLVPWTSDLVGEIDRDDLGKNLSKYTKEIIDFEHSPDIEIIKLLGALRDAINSLDKTKWVNLFDSMLNTRTDTVSLTDYHPGPSSHKKYTEWIIQHLEARNIVR